MSSFIEKIYKDIAGIEHLKKYCSAASLSNLIKWAQKISGLQIEYRAGFDNNPAITSLCKPCSMCCVTPVGTGKLSVKDIIYYSCLNIDLKKYLVNEPGMCPFWKDKKGCNLPANARPFACVKYVCAVNIPLQTNIKLHDISSKIQYEYDNVPTLDIDLKKYTSEKDR